MSRPSSQAPGKLIGKSLYVGNYYVTVQKKLGEGGFADIYQVVNRNDTSAFYALKHFRIAGDPEKLASVKRECLLMKDIKKHPNIVTLFAACFAGQPVATDGFFLMELCHQDLVKALTANHRHMTEMDVLRIFLQVAQGIGYMHTRSPPVAHWDLKAENILQSLNGAWVVCDFGSATTMDEVVEPGRVPEVEDLIRRNTTAAYRAPEMYDLWSRGRINTKVDIFALGVLLYLMCFSQFPFQADDKLAAIKGSYPMPPSNHRPATRKLISQMLCVDPVLRPDVHAVIASVQSLLEPQSNHQSPPNTNPPSASSTPPSSQPALPAPQAMPVAPRPHVHQHPPAGHMPPAPVPQQVAKPPAPAQAHGAPHPHHHAPPPHQHAPHAPPGAPHYAPAIPAHPQPQGPQDPFGHTPAQREHLPPGPHGPLAPQAPPVNANSNPPQPVASRHASPGPLPIPVPDRRTSTPAVMSASPGRAAPHVYGAGAHTADALVSHPTPDVAAEYPSSPGMAHYPPNMASPQPAAPRPAPMPVAHMPPQYPPAAVQVPPAAVPTPGGAPAANRAQPQPQQLPTRPAAVPVNHQTPPKKPEAEIQPTPSAPNHQNNTRPNTGQQARPDAHPLRNVSGMSSLDAAAAVTAVAPAAVSAPAPVLPVGQLQQPPVAGPAPEEGSPAAAARSSAAAYVAGHDLVSSSGAGAVFGLPSAATQLPAASSSPRRNQRQSASAYAYATAMNGATEVNAPPGISTGESTWSAPRVSSAAEAAAAYVDAALQSAESDGSLRVDPAAVAAIEEREKELLQLRGDAREAKEERDRLAQRLDEVMGELDKRRLQVAELRSVIDAISSHPGEDHVGDLEGAGPQLSARGAASMRRDARAIGEGFRANEAVGSSPVSPVSVPMLAQVHLNGSAFNIGTLKANGAKGPLVDRVVSVLTETADAAGRREGLRRSVSEVQVNWAEFASPHMQS